MHPVYKPFHVVGKIIRQGTIDKEKQDNAKHVACDLDNRFEPEQKMGPEENKGYKNAKRFEKKEPVPQHIGLGVYKFPFKEYADRKIDGIPQTNQQIGLPPDLWYVFNYPQGAKIVL